MWWKLYLWLWIVAWQGISILFSVAAWQTQPSNREADARYWLPHSFTPTIEPLGYPQCTAAIGTQQCLPPQTIASSPHSHSSKPVENSAGRATCFLQLSWISSQPSASHLCCPARRAVEVVSQCSVCCAHWKEADYFLAMVHWLCRLDKNEDISHWANELDCNIKAKILFLSSKVSPPPEVGPSIWGL